MEKMSAVDQLLERYFTHTSNCDAANGWCDAPEAKYENPTRGCSVTTLAGPGNRFALWPLSGLALVTLLRRRRHAVSFRQRKLRPRPRVRMLAIMLCCVLEAPTAWSQVSEETGENTAEPDPIAQPVTSAVVAREDARIDAPPAIPWGAAVNLSGSIQKAAIAAAIGARYRLNQHWLIGLDLEYNPWYARSSSEWRRGVASAYGTLIVRFPMRFERTNLRSTLQVGASRMLFDLYGVPEGTIGPYVGFNLLGLDYELGQQIYLVFNPAHIALPIPQTTGAPFSFPQHRITLGLQFGA
jgi:MYXO-CTERM domain-containing protein